MDSVESTVRAYFEALGRSDVEGIINLFAENGTLIGDEVETLAGHPQFRAALPGMFQAMNVHVDEVHFDQVREEGDHAVALTHTTDKITMLANNNVMQVAFRELFVLRKGGDGWRITDYMFNRPPNPGQ